MVQRIPLDPHR